MNRNDNKDFMEIVKCHADKIGNYYIFIILNTFAESAKRSQTTKDRARERESGR